MRFHVCFAALAATVVAASPATAQQAPASALAKGTILQSLTLVQKSDLDFGTVAPDKLLTGTVTVDADTNTRSTTGAVLTLPGAFSHAQFDGSGTAGKTVQITLGQPGGGVISNGTNTIPAALALDSVSAAPTVTIPAGGVYHVYVGGKFDIAADQPSGVYSAQFSVTATYQ
jgi:Domain of unknown function (DUF4402)